MRGVFYLAILCLLSPMQAQFSYPNILLDNEPGMYPPCEPSVAISRTDKNVIVGASILNRIYQSADGGISWDKSKVSSPYGVFGDPCIVADYRGDFYFLHLSDPSGKGWSDPSLLDRIVIQRSTDGGSTWTDGSYTGLAHPKDQDKEWMAVDPRNNRLYVSWTQFDAYESRDPDDESNILVSTARKKGRKWTAPIQINDIAGDCLDDDATTEGAVPAVGPNGEVYVAWALNEKIYFDKSTDRGKTWGEDVVVSNQPGGWTLDIPGIMRCNGMPVTLCDLSGGPHRGTIYVNWADQRNGENDTDIFVAKSTDGGDSWSDPIRVNDDIAGKQQFLTWMTVDQTTGYLYCIFYDRRNHNDLNTDVVLAYSRDGGESWTNVQISESPFLPNQNVFFGDYSNIDAHDGRIAMIWTRMDRQQTTVWASIIEDSDLPSESMGMGLAPTSSPSFQDNSAPGQDPFEDPRYPLTNSNEGPAPINPFIPLRTEGVELMKSVYPLSRNERLLREIPFIETLMENPGPVAAESEDPYLRRIMALSSNDPFFFNRPIKYNENILRQKRFQYKRDSAFSHRLIWHDYETARMAMYLGSPYGSSSWQYDPRVLMSKEGFDYLATTYPDARGMLVNLAGYEQDELLLYDQVTNRLSGPRGGLQRINYGRKVLNDEFARQLSEQLDPESAPTPHLQGEVAYFKNMLTAVANDELELLSPTWNELDTLPDLSSVNRMSHGGPLFFALLDKEADSWLESFKQEDTAVVIEQLIREMLADLRGFDNTLTSKDSAYYRYFRSQQGASEESVFSESGDISLERTRQARIQELEKALDQPEYYGNFWYTYYLMYRFSPASDHLWFLLPEHRIDYYLSEYLIQVNPYFSELIYYGPDRDVPTISAGHLYANDGHAVKQIGPNQANHILMLLDEPAGMTEEREVEFEALAQWLTQVKSEDLLMYLVEFL